MKKTMMAVGFAMMFAAAAVEWSIIKFRNPIREFMFYDSHVSVVRTALMVTGGLLSIG